MSINIKRIKELAASIDDVEEPGSLAKILYYKGLLDEEDEEYMQLLVDKLEGQEVYWERPWYQKSTAVTRPIHANGAPKGDTSGKYQLGAMSKKEKDKIDENWKNFVKEFNVPDKPNCLVRWRNKTKSHKKCPEEGVRRFVTTYLARGTKRTLYHVYRYITTHFGIQMGGPYSLEELKIMDVCFRHKPQNAVTILSKILQREPRGLYTKLIQVYHGKPTKHKINWSLGTAERYIKLLMKYTGLPLEELKNRKIDKAVWLKLEKKLHQHYFHLQRFWQESLHPQLFVKTSWKLRKLRRKIFNLLKEKPYQVWSDIRWKDIAAEFPDGFTPRFLYVISHKVIVTRRDLKSKPLQEVIEYALGRLQKKNLFKKKRMRTLGFNAEGRLVDTRKNGVRNGEEWYLTEIECAPPNITITA